MSCNIHVNKSSCREEERRRLRRDIHDGLGAQLAALIMEAGNARRSIRLDPDAADTALRELQTELRAAVVDVRRLVLGLRPPALDELGLSGALRTRLARLDGGIDEGESTLRVVFTADDPLPALPAATEVAAFRIVEEAVTNAVRHSQGSTVAVDIRTEDTWLVLTVTDDGIGMDPSREGSGLGLQSMRERAHELGGTCTIGTAVSGRGLTVRVMLPLQPGKDIQEQEIHEPDSHPDR
jgi:signal transduction histidine kinase